MSSSQFPSSQSNHITIPQTLSEPGKKWEFLKEDTVFPSEPTRKMVCCFRNSQKNRTESAPEAPTKRPNKELGWGLPLSLSLTLLPDDLHNASRSAVAVAVRRGSVALICVRSAVGVRRRNGYRICKISFYIQFEMRILLLFFFFGHCDPGIIVGIYIWICVRIYRS